MKITPGLIHHDDDFMFLHADMTVCQMGDYGEIKPWRPYRNRQVNARFLTAAWNAFVTAAERLRVDPLELAEALGDGRLSSLIAVGAKQMNSDQHRLLADTLKRIVHLVKPEANP